MLWCTITLLHMNRLNKAKSAISVSLMCSLICSLNQTLSCNDSYLKYSAIEISALNIKNAEKRRN